MTKFLYSSSLEKHMKEYMKGVDLQNQNNQYQLAQAQIVKEGEAMQLSRAEIQNKIEILESILKENIAKKLLPPEKVAQVAQVAQDQYKPMTASEYENNLRNRYKKTGVLIPEFPEVPIPTEIESIRKDRVKNILNLYNGPKDQAKALLTEVIQVALNKQKTKDLNKDELNNAIQKNLNAVVSNPNVNNKLIDELENAIRNKNLKPIPSRPIKIKKVSPFQQELTQKLDERTRLKKILPEQLSISNITTEETKAKVSKPKAKAKAKASKAKANEFILSSTASTAPTESTSTTALPSSDQSEVNKVEFRTLRKQLNDSLDNQPNLSKGKKDRALAAIKEASSNEELNHILSKLLLTEGYVGSGLRKRKSKKSK